MTMERKTKRAGGETKPPITLPANDYARLSQLALAAADRMPSVASVLAEELERAHVLATALRGTRYAWAAKSNSVTTRQARFRPRRSSTPAMRISRWENISTHSRGDITHRPRRRRLHHVGNTDGELRQLTVLAFRELQPASGSRLARPWRRIVRLGTDQQSICTWRTEWKKRPAAAWLRSLTLSA